jgi:uncharacterized protein YqhQ
MVENTSLSDRLNEFKDEGKISNQETDKDIKNIASLTNAVAALIVIFVKSFVFGYGLMTILNLHWNFLSFLCVGMSINFIIESLLELVAIIRS